MKKSIMLLLIIILALTPVGCSSASNRQVIDGVSILWDSPIPDGIDIDIQFIDQTTGFIIYTNNTGKDVVMETTAACLDGSGDVLNMVGSFWGTFIKTNEKHVDILETGEPMSTVQLDCQISEAKQSMIDDDSSVSVVSERNADDSISVDFLSVAANTGSPEMGLFVTVFYIDETGKILGYNSSSPQFIYDGGGTFEAPGFDYADYFIVKEISTLY